LFSIFKALHLFRVDYKIIYHPTLENNYKLKIGTMKSKLQLTATLMTLFLVLGLTNAKAQYEIEQAGTN
jgi:hypothetical protein